jgi:SNF2 family DNA or RNA helicase
LWKQLDTLQREAVRRFFTHGKLALFSEQRTGKTYITCGIIDQLEPEDVLLIVPLTNLESTWSTKLAELCPDYAICRTWEAFKATSGKRILLANYEALRNFISKAQKRCWGLVIFDESQRIKARGSQASRAARRLRFNPIKLILSGTPIDKSPIDVWAQLRFIEPSLLSDEWQIFVKKWCRKTGYMGYKVKFRDILLPKFLALIRPYALRITKEDMGIERSRQHLVYVPLLGDQLRIYREMRRHSVTRVNGQRSMADMTMTRIIRCHQIASGFLRLDNDELVPVGQAKQRRLRAIVKNRDFPIVVFCKYREERNIIESVLLEFSQYGAFIDGSVKDTKTKKHRTETIRAFQRGEYDWLICQIRTGGVGVDLFTARTGIVYSMPHSWIDFDQMTSRLEAMQQDGVADFFLLLCRDTVDEDIWEAICSKRQLTKVVMRNWKMRR